MTYKEYPLSHDAPAYLRKEAEEKASAELKPADKVNPNHYQHGSWEAIDIIEDVVSRECFDRPDAFCVGQALRYILRAGLKPGEDWTEDIAKAVNYLHRALTGGWVND